jgi:type IV pilus assembly protein PilC
MSALTTYRFKAMDVGGVAATGEVEAVSKQDVAEQLKARGLIVVDIAHKYRSKELNVELFQRVKADELALASRQLATMVHSGMAILRALHVLEAQTKGRLLRETIASVRGDVEAGLLLSDALERHPKVFSPLYVAMVRAGETGGLLDECLMRVADQLEKDASLRRQVRAAMVYPSLVVTFAVAVLLALVAFLIPVFENVFKQFPGKLPGLSQFMVDFSHLLTRRWYILLAVVAALVVGFLWVKRSKWGRPRWDAFKLRIPLKIGEVVQKVAIARWSRTLASLTSAGVPIMQGLEITGRTAGNDVIERAMEQVIASVKAGGTISEPLRSTPVFPPMVAQMVGVGEETGALDAMLSKIADFYDDQVAAAVKALTSILEPAMIILVGSIVGIIVISMYLPLFSVYNAIR